MSSTLFITSEHWGSPNKIGAHHLAEKLAEKGIITYLVSFPISPVYKFIPGRTQYHERSKFTKGFVEVKPNLFVFIPEVLIPPIPSIVKVLPTFLKAWTNQSTILKKIFDGMSFDFIFCESVFYLSLIDRIDSKMLIARLPDNLGGFWEGNACLLAAERQLISTADLVVTPSRLIKEELNHKYPTKNIKYLPNGVNYSNYSTETNRPSNYYGKNKVAVYIGAVATWFDHELLDQLSTKNPDWHFIVIGNNQDIRSTSSNVSYIGTKIGTEKVAYLQHADVGIIPFKVAGNETLIDYVNPIKLYEYAAAGLITISTNWAELREINGPVMLANNVNEYSVHLSNLSNISFSKQECKKFARQFDWTNITELLLNYIHESTKSDYQ